MYLSSIQQEWFKDLKVHLVPLQGKFKTYWRQWPIRQFERDHAFYTYRSAKNTKFLFQTSQRTITDLLLRMKYQRKCVHLFER